MWCCLAMSTCDLGHINPAPKSLTDRLPRSKVVAVRLAPLPSPRRTTS